MTRIVWLSPIIFIFIGIIGKQLNVEGKGVTRRFFQQRVLRSKEEKVKQKPENILGYLYNPMPQEPKFEAPVKKSFTAGRIKAIGNKALAKGASKVPPIERPVVKHKQRKLTLSKKGCVQGLELNDDFLAGSVKQSSAIENALSLQRTNIASQYHEIPRPLEEGTWKTNPQGRATKSTIDILSEKTNPEQGAKEVSRFRSEGEEKLAESSFDESKTVESLKNEGSLFRRTMPIMLKEKDVSTVKEKRSFQDEKYDTLGNGFSDHTSTTDDELKDIDWEAPEKRKHLKLPVDEKMILKHLIHQDTMAIPFGSVQEAKDEQNTINEVERLSKQSSVLPENLHLPYMNGPTDDMTTLDFSKMDVSIGKPESSEMNDFHENDDSKETFLKRHSVPATGARHEWETRNRNQIPRHHIDKPQFNVDQLGEFRYFPKQARYSAYYRSPEIRPIEMEEFHRLSKFPAIAPAILTREEKAPREPIPSREAEPEDEPAPVSEFIQPDEPAPIPELPSLREIPPIDEIREPKPEDLNPKNTFGS